jgi:hypothetical protein
VARQVPVENGEFDEPVEEPHRLVVGDGLLGLCAARIQGSSRWVVAPDMGWPCPKRRHASSRLTGPRTREVTPPCGESPKMTTLKMLVFVDFYPRQVVAETKGDDPGKAKPLLLRCFSP